MAKSHADIRLLLVQARKTEDIEHQEQACFLERCQLDPSQLKAVNVVRDTLSPALLEEADAFMIGGAGEFSAQNDYPWMPSLLDLVRAAVASNMPTFGSCWGHQVIARALGGTVIYDAEKTEMGCLPVYLNEAGQTDPLFSSFPASFMANMGHHDRVETLPDGAISLAYTESQDHQAFRIEGRPIYGTQFHSELDAAAEKARLYAYRDHYTEVETEAEFLAIVDGLAETTEVDGLLYAFLQRFVVGTSNLH